MLIGNVYSATEDAKIKHYVDGMPSVKPEPNENEFLFLFFGFSRVGEKLAVLDVLYNGKRVEFIMSKENFSKLKVIC